MNDLLSNLPRPNPQQPPAFVNARGCSDWLAVQPLANAAKAQVVLIRQVNLLNRFDIAAAERLKILELLRDPIAFAQAECARKFTGRPLPLAAAEQSALDANRALWQALKTGYLLCLAACRSGQTELAPHTALILQRMIGALRAELIDLYRAPVDLPDATWSTLHQALRLAEDLGITTQAVSDTLQPRQPTSHVANAYVQTLLLHLASPFELSGRQISQVDRWLQRWAGKVDILTAAPEAPRVPPLLVDLASDLPVIEIETSRGTLRWLDLSDLSRSIRRRIAHLQKGASPASLGLGEDCVQPDCGNLLRHLYRHWCRSGSARQHPRRSSEAHCQLVTGHDAIHYYLSGKLIARPDDAVSMTRHQADEIATFGRVASRREDDYSRVHGFMVEPWQVIDESPTGFRLSRPLEQPGARIGNGQLCAIKPGRGEHFLLAVARWSRLSRHAALVAGVQIIAGQPLAVLLRGTGLSAINESYRPGFRLAAVPALEQPEAIIIPAGWFRPGRVIELFEKSSRQIRLLNQLDRGSDFECCAFEAA